LRARLKIRPLLLRRHQRHDRGKVVRQRRSTDGKGGMRRHKANSAVGAREVQLSSTDPRSARCGGGMLAWNCMERVCGFQRTQNVPPSPKEVSSIACPTHWTRVHNASTSRKWCDGVKCALAIDGRALPGGRLGSEKSTIYPQSSPVWTSRSAELHSAASRQALLPFRNHLSPKTHAHA
jgi:hypothetical protein